MLSKHLGFVLKALIVIICCDLKSSHAQDFSYDGTMGPDHWGEQYNGCSGKFQSPINIDLIKAEEKVFPELVLKGFSERPIGGDLVNNGHTVVLQLNYENEEPTISGGPLQNETFRFTQLHFHWGDNDTYGSEDRINNVSFPAELHMVFYNTKFDNFNSALGHDNGVAVLAYFYELQEEDNENYSDLAFLLTSLQEPDHHVPFMNAPSLIGLGSTLYDKYFTYVGSLTTPPCSEDVYWIDFEVPITISRTQIEKFRHIYNHAGEPLTHNFRPVQPLNNRTVLKNVPSAQRLMRVKESDDDNDDGIISDNIPRSSSVALTSGMFVVLFSKFLSFLY